MALSSITSVFTVPANYVTQVAKGTAKDVRDAYYGVPHNKTVARWESLPTVFSNTFAFCQKEVPVKFSELTVRQQVLATLINKKAAVVLGVVAATTLGVYAVGVPATLAFAERVNTAFNDFARPYIATASAFSASAV